MSRFLLVSYSIADFGPDLLSKPIGRCKEVVPILAPFQCVSVVLTFQFKDQLMVELPAKQRAIKVEQAHRLAHTATSMLTGQ
jgi:hypothetical protein